MRNQHRATHSVCEAAVAFDVLAPPDDAIGERDARPAAGKLAHLEARAALTANIEPAAIAARGEKHVIVAALDHLGEVSIDPHHRAPALELAGTEILEPRLRALHANEQAHRAVRERHHGAFHPVRCERAGHVDVAEEIAAKGLSTATLAGDARVLAGEAVNALMRVRRADYAAVLVRRTDHAGGGGGRRAARSAHAKDPGIGGSHAEHAVPGPGDDEDPEMLLDQHDWPVTPTPWSDPPTTPSASCARPMTAASAGRRRCSSVGFTPH